MHLIGLIAEGDSIDSVMDQLLDEEKAFFGFLDSQLATVDAFYKRMKHILVAVLVFRRQSHSSPFSLHRLITRSPWTCRKGT
jgi:hypothetical protein